MGNALRGLRCAAAALALLGGRFAAAGPIDLDDFSGDETVVTFTPGFGFQNGPFTYEDVTFSEHGGGSGGDGYAADSDWSSWFANVPGSSGLAFYDLCGDSHIEMVLPPGARRVGVFLSTSPVTTWTMNLYDVGNNLIGTDTRTMPGDSQAVFIGYETSTDIDRVEIVETNGENGHITLMDDVRYEAVGGFRLRLEGDDCPGVVTLEWSGATPNRTLGLLYARNTGAVVIPNGPCAGTQLGLGAQNLRLVRTFPSGPNGEGAQDGRIGIEVCGGFIQLIESGSCLTSNVRPLP